MNTHARKRLRLKDYDYSQSGSYFVTFNSFNSKHIFGRVAHGRIVPSKIGIIVEADWREIPDHYTNVSLDEYCLMPSHFHGIIAIKGDEKRPPTKSVRHFGQSIRGSMSSIIGAFKAGVTWKVRQAKLWGRTPLWRTKFYDSIIRDDLSLYRIRRYIELNPIVWDYNRNTRRKKEKSENEFVKKLQVEFDIEGHSAYEVEGND